MACNFSKDTVPFFAKDVKNQIQQTPIEFICRVFEGLGKDLNFERIYGENVSQVSIHCNYTCKECKNVFCHEEKLSELLINLSVKQRKLTLQEYIDIFLNETGTKGSDATIYCEICLKDTLHETLNSGKVIPKEYLVILSILTIYDLKSYLFFLRYFI